MKRSHRTMALLLFVLLLPLPGWALAGEEEADAVDVANSIDGAFPVAQETEGISRSVKGNVDMALCQQIQDTYKTAQKLGRRSSFKGYCGAYVANQLVALGINTSRLSADGNRTYDIYRNMDCTTGGYAVTAYGAKEYSLSAALTAITEKDPAACNILVGFEKGTSTAGKKYGHVLFIHGIRNRNVYFSDSCTRTIDGVKYKEGEPIVCSLDAFLAQYAKYKLDGVIHFQKEERVSTVLDAQQPITEETAVISAENLAATG